MYLKKAPWPPCRLGEEDGPSPSSEPQLSYQNRAPFTLFVAPLGRAQVAFIPAVTTYTRPRDPPASLRAEHGQDQPRPVAPSGLAASSCALGSILGTTVAFGMFLSVCFFNQDENNSQKQNFH